jgi:predicted  nucleic acid-binding Zn-ribbon protein
VQASNDEEKLKMEALQKEHALALEKLAKLEAAQKLHSDEMAAMKETISSMKEERTRLQSELKASVLKAQNADKNVAAAEKEADQKYKELEKQLQKATEELAKLRAELDLIQEICGK